MAEAADINVDELRRRARRRLVGAVVLALGVAVVVPMLLETEQKPLPEDVAVKIPPIDDGTFVNRLSEHRARDSTAPAGSAPGEAPKDAAPPSAAPPSAAPPSAAPPRTSKYDTRIPDAPSVGAAPPVTSAAPSAPVPATAGPATTPPVNPNAPTAGPAPADASSPAPAGHDGFAVQLAAFADDKGANALAGRLKKAGYTAYTEPLKTSKGTLWRVRVGPYPSREAAIAARDKLKAEGQSGIVAAVK